jgi:hypothetical protein
MFKSPSNSKTPSYEMGFFYDPLVSSLSCIHGSGSYPVNLQNIGSWPTNWWDNQRLLPSLTSSNHPIWNRARKALAVESYLLGTQESHQDLERRA